MGEDLFRFCCLRPDCPDYGKRGHGNLTVCGHYGKIHRYRLLYRRTCKARFSERKGTPLRRSGLPPEKAPAVVEHLAARTGVRATARRAKTGTWRISPPISITPPARPARLTPLGG